MQPPFHLVVGAFHIQTNASKRLRASTLGVQMKSWQQRNIFLSVLGLAT
jgi:hypothetical protein